MAEPGARVAEMIGAFMESRLLLVATELGIPDELADGPRTAQELAERTNANADVLHRFLRALATEGVFVEGPPGTFANNAESETLRRGNVRRDIVLVFESIYRAFAEAPAVAREGGSMFERFFGEDYWTWLHRDPELAMAFNRFMQSGAETRVDQVSNREWGEETVVDVGGGTGGLLLELLRRHPTLRGVVFDLPEVTGEAERRIKEAGFAERLTAVGGSFFDRVPDGGDVYVLAKILHDWDDEPAAEILRTVRRAIPPHGRLLIVDWVVNEDDPANAVWSDIVMLALLNGRERSAAQWNELLRDTGFALERAEGLLVEAVPV